MQSTRGLETINFQRILTADIDQITNFKTRDSIYKKLGLKRLSLPEVISVPISGQTAKIFFPISLGAICARSSASSLSLSVAAESPFT